MDIQQIKLILDSMKEEMFKLTSGNVSHKKASLIWAVQELQRLLDEQ